MSRDSKSKIWRPLPDEAVWYITDNSEHTNLTEVVERLERESQREQYHIVVAGSESATVADIDLNEQELETVLRVMTAVNDKRAERVQPSISVWDAQYRHSYDGINQGGAYETRQE